MGGVFEETLQVNKYTIVGGFLGAVNVAFLLYAHWNIDPQMFSDGGVVLVLTAPIVFLGPFLLGAVPGYLLVRYRIVSPLPISGFLTWYAFVDRGSMEPFIVLYSNPIVHAYSLGVLVVVGFAEYLVRDQVPYVSHDPIL
ncbi:MULTISPECIES: hypothetical protein [Halomicrobium]|uniref:Uncharacterized protein n=2 Tax=Halomicrobium mukohataei TaxID=57705 RepID=C7P033_HALMD|nr:MULTISPECIES: hypothetical protein [Halomicrobium]ACV46941.1 hypothetical protein Hmuk_0810 [Halomicrobium mukohataei DSM 12286]QCD65436.1 hypothetical protein E5139_07215 [Halomicrobium mukohataei]QFR20242.1 hypothetical protein GBQ70_07210 [Halomicrobium sp. ZPS1]